MKPTDIGAAIAGPGGPPPTGCPVVAVAASAGGLEALSALLPSIPAGFPAAVAVVLHRSVRLPHLLVGLLRGRSALPVRDVVDGGPLEPATVHVCPAGVHLTAGRTWQLLDGPRLNYVRPSADLLFVSLARALGRRAVGVVLSGMGTDGAIGSKAIVDAGGTVVAQDPATAAHPDMPLAAAALGPAQLVLPPAEIGPALQAVLRRLAREPDGFPPGRPPAGRALNPAAARVLLADDHRIVLDGLRALLNGEPDFVVLPPGAEDGRAAVRLAAELAPDVVVMDLAMPGMDGVAATRQILAGDPGTRVIALTAHAGTRTTDRALRAGASAVLSKQKAFDELPAAIRAVLSGRVYVSRRGHAATETPRTVAL